MNGSIDDYCDYLMSQMQDGDPDHAREEKRLYDEYIAECERWKAERESAMKKQYDVVRQLYKKGECTMSSNELGTVSKTTIKLETLS